ncbi:MAG: PAS domain S-box protein [Candidatus Bathyarchaeota archaeon]|jgi:PAS domain S-box-containing protein
MTQSSVDYQRDFTDITKEALIQVLHVDDDASFLKAAKPILEMQGNFRVETASSVEEATEILEKKSFDVIVSDYVMPGKTGLDFLKELRDSGDNIPFIIFTGKGREEVAIQALNLGADHYINKIGKTETVYYELAHGILQAVEIARASAGIWKREQRLSAIFASSPDAIIVSDLQANIVDCNEAAWRLSGYSSEEEMLGKSAFELIAEKDRKRALENLEKTLEQGTTRNTEYILLKKNGEEFIGELSASLIKEPSGNPTGFVAVVRDITERKKAEEELKKFKVIIETANYGVGLVDVKTDNLVYTNNELNNMLGYNAGELTGRNYTTLHSKEQMKNAARIRETFFKKGKVQGEELEYKRKDNSTFCGMIVVNPVTDEKGEPIFAAVNVIDITERKKAEEALNESERRYRKLFKSTKDGIIVSGPDGKIMSVNSAAAEMLGYEEPEELLGTPVVQFYKESKQRKKLFEKLKKNGYLKDFEVVGRRKDGSAFTSIGTFTLHRDEEGNILRTEGIFRDVTQHKHAEESVRESEEKYRSIVELAPDGIITVSTRGVVTSVNSAFSKLTGFAEDELVGKHFTKLGTVRMREIPKYIRIFTTILRGKISSPVDFSYHRKDGTLGWAEAQAGLLKSRGKTVGVQAIVRDITERKKADVKLEEVNEKLGVVGELTRHDARNKLSTVKMNTFLMKQRLVDDPEALKHLNEIESACKQVERIFDFAKVYEKIGMEELAYMNVEKTLVEAVMLFPDLQAMKVVNDCKGLTVLADSLLRQLFYNLIDNSLKHGEKINQIRLYCKEAGKDQLKLVYGDDGAGIPKAEKKKIFKEGYGKGTGYGLYLISKMCDVYGWTIRETGKQGKGAHFTITIPKSGQDGRENFRIK